MSECWYCEYHKHDTSVLASVIADWKCAVKLLSEQFCSELGVSGIFLGGKGESRGCWERGYSTRSVGDSVCMIGRGAEVVVAYWLVID